MAMWLLFRTLRLRVVASSTGTNPYDKSTGQRYLYCVWHDSMVIPAFAGKHRCTSALISQHADGSFVAQVLRLNNISAIRGSTNRITPGAIRDLLKRTKDQHVVITPDGPRGPNRCMSNGIAFIASRTGRAVIPTAYACSRHWRIRGSWSDLIIPKPFAKVFLLGGDPMYVASGLATDQLQNHVASIQTEMDRLNEAAEALSKPKACNQTSSGAIRGQLDET